MKLSTRGILIIIALCLFAVTLFSSCTGTLPGTLSGNIKSTLGGTVLMLVQINDIKDDGISVTMREDLIITNANGRFVFTNVPPGRYLLFNNSLIIAIFRGSGKDKIDTEFKPFPTIEYEDAIKLTEEFYLSDFVKANDKLVVFTIKPMGIINIDRPIHLYR